MCRNYVNEEHSGEDYARFGMVTRMMNLTGSISIKTTCSFCCYLLKVFLSFFHFLFHLKHTQMSFNFFGGLPFQLLVHSSYLEKLKQTRTHKINGIFLDGRIWIYPCDKHFSSLGFAAKWRAGFFDASVALIKIPKFKSSVANTDDPTIHRLQKGFQ